MARGRSVREAARRLSTTPGEVSKALKGMEKKIGVSLFIRSAQGVLLSEVGTQVALLVEEMLEVGRQIESVTDSSSKKANKKLAIGATSFLLTHLIVPEVTSFLRDTNNILFRFLDLSPDELVSVGLRGVFDICFHFGTQEWPRSWMSKKIGSMDWVLCCKASHPLAKKATLKEVLEFPFVIPTYFTNEGLQYGNDNFPVAISKRKKGFETSTADASIPILLHSNHIAFLPETLVISGVRRKELKIISPPEISPVSKDLYISIRTDQVSASLYSQLVQHFESKL